MHQPLKGLCTAAALAGVLITLGGCEVAEPSAETAAAPPPQGGVMELQARDVTLSTEVAGRTTPYLIAEVRPSQVQQQGMRYDSTPFVRISIEEVVKTLAEAVVLVFLVMYLFLQSFRATLIPTLAVPVVLLGTFGVLAAFGYSINTLTMFAMVLAIGLLVDDAIVVVENVERVMREDRLSPREATRRSMGQITGALIGIAPVLSAVFVPMAFFGGSTGVIYRQFSVTIVSAMLLSVVVALILTPALCATLLKPSDHNGHAIEHGFYVPLFFVLVKRYQGGRRQVASGNDRAPALDLAEVNHS